MPKKKALKKTTESAKPESQEAAAQAAPETAAIETHPTAETASEVAPSVPDDTDSKNADETASIAKQLEQARAEIKNLQNRLSAVSAADDIIVKAELRATEAQQALASADQERKDCKKAADAALENLRRVVRDRMTGQTLLKFPEETAPAQPATAGTAKPVAAPFDPKTVETKPADAKDDADERPTAPAATVTHPTGADPLLDARIGSVSVKGDGTGEMIAVTPGVVSALATAGFNTVRELLPKLTDKSLKVAGVGPVKLKELGAIIKLWMASAPPTAAPAGAGHDAKPEPERGEPTHRACGVCQHAWALPSEVVKCSECGEENLTYDVGFFGEPTADIDGDMVIRVENVLVRLPKTADIPGIEDYGFSVLVAQGKDGQWRSGWEIMYGENTSGGYPSILNGDATDRRTALSIGFGRLKREVSNLLNRPAALAVWETAAMERIGVSAMDSIAEVTPASDAADKPLTY